MYPRLALNSLCDWRSSCTSDSPVLVSPLLELQEYTIYPHWGLNSGPHSCHTSTLPAEFYYKPLCILLLNHAQYNTWQEQLQGRKIDSGSCFPRVQSILMARHRKSVQFVGTWDVGCLHHDRSGTRSQGLSYLLLQDLPHPKNKKTPQPPNIVPPAGRQCTNLCGTFQVTIITISWVFRISRKVGRIWWARPHVLW